jgi:hypothetical protein
MTYALKWIAIGVLMLRLEALAWRSRLPVGRSAQFVPGLCPQATTQFSGGDSPAAERKYAKRQFDASTAATWTECLGIPLARTRGQHQTNPSQNSAWLDRLVDEAAARQAIATLCININPGDARIETRVTKQAQAEYAKLQ